MKSKRQAHPRPILINPVSSNQNKSRKKEKRAPFPANPHWFISLETNKQAESAPHRSKQAHSSSSRNLLSTGAGPASPPALFTWWPLVEAGTLASLPSLGVWRMAFGCFVLLAFAGAAGDVGTRAVTYSIFLVELPDIRRKYNAKANM